MSSDVVLFDYWRSSASYRVRIALNLLGISYRAEPVDLLAGGQRDTQHLDRNPQGLVPALSVDGQMLTQSLAIIEYLHATRSGSTLLPTAVLSQARVRSLSYAIAMEIHPICNLKVVDQPGRLTDHGDAGRRAWMQHFIGNGLEAFELLVSDGDAGLFAHGDTPTMADCCLVPQLYNARRWGLDFQALPTISRIAINAEELDAFQAAHPDAIGPPSG